MYDTSIYEFIRNHLGIDGFRVGDLERCKPDSFERMLFEHCGELLAAVDSPYPAECRLNIPRRRVDNNKYYELQKG